MACWITQDCISCGICIGQCPNNAIYVNHLDAYAVDPNRCTECVDQPRRRCLLICSAGAIQPDPNRIEPRERLWARHRKLRERRIEDDW